MKVLHVITNADIGGIERLVAQICRELRVAHGATSDILCTMRGEGTLNGYLQSLGIVCLSGKLSSGMDFQPWKLHRIKRMMRDYDVVHIHSANFFVILTAYLSGRKVCFSEHGGFGFGSALSWRKRCMQKLKGFALRHWVDRVFFNSEFSRQTAILRYGAKLGNGLVIYNGVEQLPPAGAIDAETQARTAGKFVVCVAARFARVKRIDRLIAAFDLFRRSHPDALLLLVGDGPLRAEYEEQRRRLQLEELVHFAGFRQNVYDYLRCADVSVLPSANEAFGLSYIESLAAGTACVVFADGGGLAEIARQFDPADVVPDEAGLARRLAYYRHDDKDAAARRQAFAGRFSMEKMVNTLYQEYQAQANG